MKVTKEFCPGDRYVYDWQLLGNGYAQVDTTNDAWYFGIWCNPWALAVITYCEGDVTTVVCDNSAEFEQEIRRIKEFFGDGFLGIDPGLSANRRIRVAAVGLGDLLH